MSNVYLQDSTLTSIGGAIREKLNVDTKYLPSEMPEAIRSISGGGEEDHSDIILPGGFASRTAAPGTSTTIFGCNIYPLQLADIYQKGYHLHVCALIVFPYSTLGGEYGVNCNFVLRSSMIATLNFDGSGLYIIPKENVHFFNGLDFDSRFIRQYAFIDVDLFEAATTFPTEYSSGNYITLSLLEYGVNSTTPVVDSTGLWPAQTHMFFALAKPNHDIVHHLIWYDNPEQRFLQDNYYDTLQDIYQEHPNYSTQFYELLIGSTTISASRYISSVLPYQSINYRSGTNTPPVTILFIAYRYNGAISNGGFMQYGNSLYKPFGGEGIRMVPGSSLSTTYYDQALLMFSIEPREV